MLINRHQACTLIGRQRCMPSSATCCSNIWIAVPVRPQHHHTPGGGRLQQHVCSAAPDTIIPAAGGASEHAAPAQQQTISVVHPEGQDPFSITLQVPPGAEVYQVALKKPLGFTLTEKPGGLIVVDELQAGGHAQAAGVTVGDVLLAVTARSQEPGGSSPKLVLLKTQGQSFKTVAAGLRSNTCAQCRVVLLLQRQKP